MLVICSCGYRNEKPGPFGIVHVDKPGSKDPMVLCGRCGEEIGRLFRFWFGT